MSQHSVHNFPTWVQVHGSLKYCNLETVRYIGDKLGKFICYDKKGTSNGFGLRFQLFLTDKGVNAINLNDIQLLVGQPLEFSIVLEQVGRFCLHCMCIGHVAQSCKLTPES